MIFNSYEFIEFFIISSLIYFVVPQRVKWLVLLVASYIFYMAWRTELIVLIIFSTFINYFFARRIYKQKDSIKKKRSLIVCLIINFGLLFVFKYLAFATNTFEWLFGILGIACTHREFDIILPMGISFYTFQASAYTIDVYRGDIKPERNFLRFSLFITFFPQLVAGPIERTKNLLPQFYEKHKFNLHRVYYGVQIMLYGFFKKVVIADRVAVAVNTVYNNAGNYSGLSLIVATVLFAFQIYCDFSGYSDIAKGAAKVLGFELMDNFKSPYLSTGIKDFWRRWHISLSTWFMDYVYIPLGGNRCGKVRSLFNLFVTFLVSGLWHGANWTFVCWGALHGIYMVIGRLIGGNGKKTEKGGFVLNILKCAFTFALVTFGWIFFRANTVSDAFYIIAHLFDNISNWTSLQYLYTTATGLGLNVAELFVVAGSIMLLVLFELISGKKQVFDYFRQKPYIINVGFMTALAVIILTTGVFYNAGEFIYFQF
ncbi:MAG: MBOAT family protein [Firmicutes bacterium]|nr:MBOAT family protein [Bacillota bacterium]